MDPDQPKPPARVLVYVCSSEIDRRRRVAEWAASDLADMNAPSDLVHRACGLYDAAEVVPEDEPPGTLFGADCSQDRCHHPWPLEHAERAAAAWNAVAAFTVEYDNGYDDPSVVAGFVDEPTARAFLDARGIVAGDLVLNRWEGDHQTELARRTERP